MTPTVGLLEWQEGIAISLSPGRSWNRLGTVARLGGWLDNPWGEARARIEVGELSRCRYYLSHDTKCGYQGTESGERVRG